MKDKMQLFSSYLYSVIRVKDWQHSVLPFAIGCLYFSFSLFESSFNFDTLLFLILFTTSSIGFAATGYLINEFFDIETDRIAGKKNHLSAISSIKIIALFVFALTFLFTPWFWLPSDTISWLLIFSEIILLLTYSMPFIRLKNNYFFSGIVDSLYAYVIPILLVFHTTSIFYGRTFSSNLMFLLIAAFLFGFRNIIVHQSRDMDNDLRAAIVTLPHRLGVRNTNGLLMILLILEIISISTFSILLSIRNPIYIIWLFLYFVIILFSFSELKSIPKQIKFATETRYSITDIAYQIWFPLFNLSILVFIDWHWLIVIPVHVILFIPQFRLELVYFKIEMIYLKLKVAWHFVVLHFISRPINFLIYYFFRIFNVDLRKKNMSAFVFLLSIFKK